MAWTEFVNGTPSDADEMNNNLLALARINAEQLYKQLASSLSFENKDLTAAENYTSAIGANSTVSIGAETDATFVTDRYIMGYSTPLQTQAHGESFASGGNQSGKRGVRIKAKDSIIVVSATKAAGQGALNCYLYSDNAGVPNVLLDSVLFTGSVATFTTPHVMNNGDYVWIMTDSGESNYATRFTTSSLPITTNLYIDWHDSYKLPSTPLNGSIAEIASVEIKEAIFAENSQITCDSNTLDITTEDTAFLLHWEGEIPGTASGSFDLSDGVNTINLPVNKVTKKTAAVPRGALTNVSDIKVIQKLSDADGDGIYTKGWGLIKL